MHIHGWRLKIAIIGHRFDNRPLLRLPRCLLLAGTIC